jgi:hypothetical protein
VRKDWEVAAQETVQEAAKRCTVRSARNAQTLSYCD